jgi:hypothetical protein
LSIPKRLREAVVFVCDTGCRLAIENIKIIYSGKVQQALSCAQGKKVHRHCTKPAFVRATTSVLLRRLIYRINQHVWRNNEHAIQYRISAGKRLAIRSEARDVLTPLCKAIAYYTEWGDTKNQFECWADIPQLAKTINAAYVRDDAVMRYDAVYNALEMLEGMQAVLLIRDYDKNTKRYKLSRVFVLPVFFRMFGFSEQETRTLLDNNQAFFAKKPKDVEQREKFWAPRINDTTRAKIRGMANAKKLACLRKQFKASSINDSKFSASVIQLAATASHDAFEGKNRFFSERSNLQQESMQLRAEFSPAEIYLLRIKLKGELSTLCDADIEQALDAELRKLRQLRL